MTTPKLKPQPPISAPRLAVMVCAALLAACAQQPAAPKGVPVPPPVKVERSRIEMNRDDALTRLVGQRLLAADKDALRAITVEVFEGRALMAGAVAKPEHRRRAEAAARAVEGVTEVFNEVVVAEEKTFANYAAHPALERDLRSRMLDDRSLGGVYALRMVNGVAYLLGTVGSPDEVDRAKALLADAEGVKWVVAYIKVR